METPLTARDFLKRFHLPQLVRIDPSCIRTRSGSVNENENSAAAENFNENLVVKNNAAHCGRRDVEEDENEQVGQVEETNSSELLTGCNTSVSSSFMAVSGSKPSIMASKQQQHQQQQHEKSDWTYQGSMGNLNHNNSNTSQQQQSHHFEPQSLQTDHIIKDHHHQQHQNQINQSASGCGSGGARSSCCFDQSTFSVQQDTRHERRRRQQQLHQQPHHHHHHQQQHQFHHHHHQPDHKQQNQPSSSNKSINSNSNSNNSSNKQQQKNSHQLSMRLTPPSSKPSLSKLTLDQPFLLYKAYKKFELCAYVIDAKNELHEKSGDPVYFPQNYPGWFSICSSVSGISALKKQNFSINNSHNTTKHQHRQPVPSLIHSQPQQQFPLETIDQVCRSGTQIFLTRDEIIGYKLPIKLSHLTKLKNNQLLALPLAINLNQNQPSDNVIKSTRNKNKQIQGGSVKVGNPGKEQGISDIKQTVIRAGQVLKICGIYEDVLPLMESQNNKQQQQQHHNSAQVVARKQPPHRQHVVQDDSFRPYSYMYNPNSVPVTQHQMAPSNVQNPILYQQMASHQQLQLQYVPNSIDLSCPELNDKKKQKFLKISSSKSTKSYLPVVADSGDQPIPSGSKINIFGKLKSNNSSQHQQPSGQRYARCIVMNQKSVDKFTNCISPSEENDTTRENITTNEEQVHEEEIEVLIPVDQRGRFYQCATSQSIVSELYCSSCSTGSSNLIFRLSQIVALINLSHRLTLQNVLRQEQRNQQNPQNLKNGKLLDSIRPMPVPSSSCVSNQFQLPLTVQLVTGPRPRNFSPSMFGTSSTMESYFNCEQNIGGHLITCKYNKNCKVRQVVLKEGSGESGEYLENGSLNKRKEKESLRSSLSGPSCSCAQFLAPSSEIASKHSEIYGNFSALLRIERIIKRDVLLACTIKSDPLVHLDMLNQNARTSNFMGKRNSEVLQQKNQKVPAGSKKGNHQQQAKDEGVSNMFQRNRDKLLALRENSNLDCETKKVDKRIVSDTPSSSFSRLRVCRSLISLNGRRKKKRPDIPSSMLNNLPIATHNRSLVSSSIGGAVGVGFELLDNAITDGNTGGLYTAGYSMNEIASNISPDSRIVLVEFDCNDDELKFVRTFIESSIPTSTIPDLVLNRMDFCNKNSLYWERQLKLSYRTLCQDYDTCHRQLEQNRCLQLKLLEERRRVLKYGPLVINPSTISCLRDSSSSISFNELTHSSLELSNLNAVFQPSKRATAEAQAVITTRFSTPLSNNEVGSTLNNSTNNNSTASSRSSSGVSSAGEKHGNVTRGSDTTVGSNNNNRSYTSSNTQSTNTASPAASLSSNSSSSLAIEGATSGQLKRPSSSGNLLLRLVHRILPNTSSSSLSSSGGVSAPMRPSVLPEIPAPANANMNENCDGDNFTTTTGASSVRSSDCTSEPRVSSTKEQQKRVMEELSVRFQRELKVDCSPVAASGDEMGALGELQEKVGTLMNAQKVHKKLISSKDDAGGVARGVASVVEDWNGVALKPQKARRHSLIASSFTDQEHGNNVVDKEKGDNGEGDSSSHLYESLERLNESLCSSSREAEAGAWSLQQQGQYNKQRSRRFSQRTLMLEESTNVGSKQNMKGLKGAGVELQENRNRLRLGKSIEFLVGGVGRRAALRQPHQYGSSVRMDVNECFDSSKCRPVLDKFLVGDKQQQQQFNLRSRAELELEDNEDDDDEWWQSSTRESTGDQYQQQKLTLKQVARFVEPLDRASKAVQPALSVGFLASDNFRSQLKPTQKGENATTTTTTTTSAGTTLQRDKLRQQQQERFDGYLMEPVSIEACHDEFVSIVDDEEDQDEEQVEETTKLRREQLAAETLTSLSSSAEEENSSLSLEAAAALSKTFVKRQSGHSIKEPMIHLKQQQQQQQQQHAQSQVIEQKAHKNKETSVSQSTSSSNLNSEFDVNDIEEEDKEDRNQGNMEEGIYINLTRHNNNRHSENQPLQTTERHSRSSYELNRVCRRPLADESSRIAHHKPRIVVSRMERKLMKMRARNINNQDSAQQSLTVQQRQVMEGMDIERNNRNVHGRGRRYDDELFLDDESCHQDWHDDYQTSLTSLIHQYQSKREKHYYNDDHEYNDNEEGMDFEDNLRSINLPPIKPTLEPASSSTSQLQLNQNSGWTSLVTLTTSKASAFKSIDSLNRHQHKSSLRNQDGFGDRRESSSSSENGENEEANDSFSTSSSFDSIDIHKQQQQQQQQQQKGQLFDNWTAEPLEGAGSHLVNLSLDGAIMVGGQSSQHLQKQNQHATSNSLGSSSSSSDTSFSERPLKKPATIMSKQSEYKGSGKGVANANSSTHTSGGHSTDSSLRPTSSSNNSANELAELDDDVDQGELDDDDEDVGSTHIGEVGEDWRRRVNGSSRLEKQQHELEANAEDRATAFKRSNNAQMRGYTVGQVTVANGRQRFEARDFIVDSESCDLLEQPQQRRLPPQHGGAHKYSRSGFGGRLTTLDRGASTRKSSRRIGSGGSS